MLWTPLEQFQIISLFSIKLFSLDFSITNLVLINIIVIIFFSSIVMFSSSNTNSFQETSFFFIPNSWQTLIESVYETSSQLLFDNINEEGEKYFPFIAVLFSFILFSNLIGLIPYSFTVTSHLIVTFTLSLSVAKQDSPSELSTLLKFLVRGLLGLFVAHFLLTPSSW